jgi:hypothetical protein
MANATFGEWCWGNSVWNEMVGKERERSAMEMIRLLPTIIPAHGLALS